MRINDTLKQFIDYQYAANSTLDLPSFCSRDSFSGYIVHPDLVDFVRSQRDLIIQSLQAEVANLAQSSQQGLIRFFLTRIQKYLYQNNQFIMINEETRAGLERLYGDYLLDFLKVLIQSANVADGLRAVIERHLRAFQAFVFQLDTHLIRTPVVCAEYSPALQLQILGMDVATLIEPVLDVGCGSQSYLVHHLRSMGFDAYGLDRDVEAAPFLINADWLHFSFGMCCWGTIVSHMAFSNHFLFHHQYMYGVPEHFAYKYKEMLDALRVGGWMYYAPSLPFIEQVLPAHFAVERVTKATHLKRLA